MSFRRSTTALAISASKRMWLRSTPSIRNRTCSWSDCGSKWMSEARDRTASSNTPASSRATGVVSSGPLLASCASIVVSGARSAFSSRARPASPSPLW